MSVLEFKQFGKICRLNRDICITEKIDGTNACVIIAPGLACTEVGAQSKNKIITPENDNMGFARWVAENAATLVKDLGPGYHFGEWFGKGIQRGYGLEEKRFCLFNTSLWSGKTFETPRMCVVPTLYQGPWFDQETKEWAPTRALEGLAAKGSMLVPGYMRPEGIVIWHDQGKLYFKATLENDQAGKNYGG